MRINGFHQITAFYSIVFSQEYDFKPQHISLYTFLLNQNNRNNWVEWFKCPLDLGMAGSCIGSKKTYYACLDDLQSWKLLKYTKGENMWKAPKIRLEVLKNTSTYTSTVPQSEPLPEPLPIPDQHHNLPTYINLQPTTLNNKQYTGDDAPRESFSKPSQDEIAKYVLEKNPTGNPEGAKTFAMAFWSHYENNGWKVGKNKMKNWTLAIVQWKDTLQKHIFPNGQPQTISTSPNRSQLQTFRIT